MTMVSYSVDVDKDQLAEAQSVFRFVGGNSDRALIVAINRTGKKIRTLSSKRIREQVNLKKRYVDKNLAFIGAKMGRIEGILRAESRGLLTAKYSTDRNISSGLISWIKPPPIPARGIRVKVKPAGSPKPLAGHFYMVLKGSRAVGLVRRLSESERARAMTSRKGAGSRGGRFKVAYSPSISQVFSDVRGDVMPEAGRIMTSALLDAMRDLLARKAPLA